MPYSHLLSTSIRLLIYTLVILYSWFEESPKILLSFTIVANLSIIFKTHRCLPILLMFLFFSTYIVNLIPFFFAGEYIFYYPPKDTFYETLQVHSFFLFSLDIFTRPIRRRFFISDTLEQKKNWKAFIFLCILFLFFLIFSIQGDTILQTGGYGQQGNTTSLGGFGMYFVILLPLMYIYSGKEKKFKIIVILLCLLMTLKMLLYGGRMIVLIMGLLIFMLYYDNEKKHLSILKIILLALPILYIFILLGAIRANPINALSSSWEDLLLLPFKENLTETLIEFFGNQNDIFYSSTVLTQTVVLDIFNMYDRLEIFFYNIISIITPYSMLPDKASLITYIQKNVAITGGGALVSSYAYFFLSFPGIIMIAYFISFIVNNMQKSTNIPFKLYAIMILVTFPSWFGYNIISLFKISFYIIPLYFITRLLFVKNEKKHTICRGTTT